MKIFGRGRFFKFIASIFLVAGLFIGTVLASEIQVLDSPEIKGDFVLGPGKTELIMSPGEKYTKELMITNRLGETRKFKLEIEDFQGSSDPERNVELLGNKKGPFSLKDYLKPELMEFILNHNERIILPINIEIPQSAEPGGLYGSVIVTTQPIGNELEAEKEKVKGQTKIISRLGSLFYIRIKGDVREEGYLQKFGVKDGKGFFEKGPVGLEILFENRGNVHLAPFGSIEIKNILDQKIDEINIDPWFILPNSSRIRHIEWLGKDLLFGRYTAKLLLNRGYEDKIDQRVVSFWVIPWKMIALLLVALFILIGFLRWLGKKFRFEIKKR